MVASFRSGDGSAGIGGERGGRFLNRLERGMGMGGNLAVATRGWCPHVKISHGLRVGMGGGSEVDTGWGGGCVCFVLCVRPERGSGGRGEDYECTVVSKEEGRSESDR